MSNESSHTTILDHHTTACQVYLLLPPHPKHTMPRKTKKNRTANPCPSSHLRAPRHVPVSPENALPRYRGGEARWCITPKPSQRTDSLHDSTPNKKVSNEILPIPSTLLPFRSDIQVWCTWKARRAGVGAASQSDLRVTRPLDHHGWKPRGHRRVA